MAQPITPMRGKSSKIKRNYDHLMRKKEVVCKKLDQKRKFQTILAWNVDRRLIRFLLDFNGIVSSSHKEMIETSIYVFISISFFFHLIELKLIFQMETSFFL